MTGTDPGDGAAAASPAGPRPGPLWVGTSWKMNKTLAEAAAFVDGLLAYDVPPGLQPFVLPALTALAHVRQRLPADSPVLLGAQNAHWGPEGAGTGEVSMRMVADAGARLVEMGHSERRADFGETDETVARKAEAALAQGLIPLICVGEPWSVRTSGRASDFVAGQLRAALGRLTPDQVPDVLVAYEPIWAIGEHGRPATQEQTGPVMALVQDVVGEASGGRRARAVLYGGSVSPGNAVELLADPSTDGLFVGRAAWPVEGYTALLDLCAAAAAV